jgi:hypothetical protein
MHYGETIRGLFSSFNERSVSGIEGLLDDEVVFENRSTSVLRGKQQVLAFYRDLMATMPAPTLRDVGFVLPPDQEGKRGRWPAGQMRVCVSAQQKGPACNPAF